MSEPTPTLRGGNRYHLTSCHHLGWNGSIWLEWIYSCAVLFHLGTLTFVCHEVWTHSKIPSFETP